MNDLVQIETVDFNQSYWRRTVAERVKEQFDKHALLNVGDGYRSHLGASLIGTACTRSLWYHFRWFKSQIPIARMASLFNQGHRIEKLIVDTLKDLGAEFYHVDPTDHSKQLRFNAINGHFGGSVDGVFRWPAIGIFDWTLLECKSSKTGSPFTELFKKEVIGAHFQHYAQQSTYGRFLGIRNALYICYNKNDSQIYYEIVDLDWKIGEEMAERANYVIHTTEPPPKINKNPTYFVCKMCDFWDLCQGPDEIRPVRNCRNCRKSRPVEDEKWHCDHWNQIIPKDFIPKGCTNHVYLPY